MSVYHGVTLPSADSVDVGDLWYDSASRRILTAIGDETWIPVMDTSVTINVNGVPQSMSFNEISKLATDDVLLKALVEEQPAVKEVYERLQVLVKMYGKPDEQSTTEDR